MLCVALVLSLMVPVHIAAAAPAFTPGTFVGEGIGYDGPLTVEVTFSASAILEITLADHTETPGFYGWVEQYLIPEIIEHQTVNVDIISGVTMTSFGVLLAVRDAITQAGADPRDLMTPVERVPDEDIDLTADVIIVGGGGAGLTAAVTALEEGASVVLIEMQGFLGGNTLVAGGIYNAANPAKQELFQAERSTALDSLIIEAIEEDPISDEHAELIAIVRAEFEEYLASDRTMFDSASWHALQTWRGGDMLADLSLVRIMTGRSYETLAWLVGNGLELHTFVTHGAGSMYPRTHNAILPNGYGYIRAVVSGLENNPNYTQLLNTTGVSLIMDGDTVVGVNAIGRDGNTVTLMANNGVIMATGGFAGNVEMRQYHSEGYFFDYLGPTLLTSNLPGVTGHGIYMARDAGAVLVNMEQVQLLHINSPVSGGTYDIMSSAMSAVFVNREGERFSREDGRRDVLSSDVLAQTDGMFYAIWSADFAPEPDLDVSLGGRTLAWMLENERSNIVTADTIEELAELIGVPADTLVATIDQYNLYMDAGVPDSFGRASFPARLETAPFYAYPRAPSAHHTMGGVVIDQYTRVLREDGSAIAGLYAAGEITGVLHGTNRLGANALVDIFVFGRIAGESAANSR